MASAEPVRANGASIMMAACMRQFRRMRRAAAVLAPRPLLAGAGVGAFAAAVVMLPGLLSCRRWRRRARSSAPSK